MTMQILDSHGFGKKTETAGTIIVLTFPPKKGLKTKLSQVKVTPGATAHTLTGMIPLGKTTLSAAAAAAQTDIILTADPGPSGNGIAANDYLVILKPDQTVHVGIVSTWTSGTKTVVLTANVPTGGFSDNAEVWFLGVAGDHTDRQWACGASATTTLQDSEGGLCSTSNAYEPMMLQENNATNAGTIDLATAMYAWCNAPAN